MHAGLPRYNQYSPTHLLQYSPHPLQQYPHYLSQLSHVKLSRFSCRTCTEAIIAHKYLRRVNNSKGVLFGFYTSGLNFSTSVELRLTNISFSWSKSKQKHQQRAKEKWKISIDNNCAFLLPSGLLPFFATCEIHTKQRTENKPKLLKKKNTVRLTAFFSGYSK